MKVNFLQPAYFDRFACTGSSCEDTCCAGWRIIIDKKTYRKYRNIRNPEFDENLSRRVKRIRGVEASDLAYARFELADTKCPFWLEDGLCELQKDYGEDYLCATCRIYPRQFNMVLDDLVEASLTMSCPEAARLALFDPEPISFETVEKELKANHVLFVQPIFKPQKGEGLEQYVWEIREAVIDLLQDRSQPLNARIFAAGMMLQKLGSLENPERETVLRSISDLTQASERGELTRILSERKDNENIRLTMNSILIKALLINMLGSSWSGTFCREFMQRYLDGSQITGSLRSWYLSIHANGAEALKEKAYSEFNSFIEDRIARHWNRFLERQGYVLENYLVNAVFSLVLPFKHRTELDPYHHFVLLVEQYAMARMLICGAADNEGGVTDEFLRQVVSFLSNEILHSGKAKAINEAYVATGYDSLAHMSFLLRV